MRIVSENFENDIVLQLCLLLAFGAFGAPPGYQLGQNYGSSSGGGPVRRGGGGQGSYGGPYGRGGYRGRN